MKRLLTCCLVMLMFASCHKDEVSTLFCNLPARFTFSPVNSISQLYTSCESLGEWCSVEVSNNKVFFKKASGSTGEANLTAQINYTGFYMGLSGFIVGLPNIPEMGNDMPVLTCYDLACSNCYNDYYVARRMELKEGGTAFCSRCERTYNLNSQGIVVSGEGGRPLYRYRVYYGNNTLSVAN